MDGSSVVLGIFFILSKKCAHGVHFRLKSDISTGIICLAMLYREDMTSAVAVSYEWRCMQNSACYQPVIVMITYGLLVESNQAHYHKSPLPESSSSSS